MQPVVAFPDAVLVVIDYLREKMPDLMVGSRVPEDRPSQFVRVRRTGGLRRTLVNDRPRIDFQCWARTEEEAETLMSRVRAYTLAMAGTRGTTTVYRVREVGGPQWMPDNESNQPRYGFAVEFSTRGTELE